MTENKVKPGQGLGRGKGRAPRIDREEVARQYVEEGRTVSWLMREHHCSDMTIYRALDAMGVKRRYGSTKDIANAVCRHGHARVLWGHKTKDGRWRCRKCDERSPGYLYLVWKGGKLLSIQSTPERAMKSTGPKSEERFVNIKPLEEWFSSDGYEITRMVLDG